MINQKRRFPQGPEHSSYFQLASVRTVYQKPVLGREARTPSDSSDLRVYLKLDFDFMRRPRVPPKPEREGSHFFELHKLDLYHNFSISRKLEKALGSDHLSEPKSSLRITGIYSILEVTKTNARRPT